MRAPDRQQSNESSSSDPSSRRYDEDAGFECIDNLNEINYGTGHRKLGHGTYGTVIPVTFRGRAVALKQFNSIDDYHDARKEAKVIHGLKHEHIIELYAYIRAPDTVGLLLELMSGGSLFELLHKHSNIHYYADHALGWACQAANALTFMHSKHYLHRDLKPSNMLLSEDFLLLKICDFGTTDIQKSIMTDYKGSAAYMAPEVFRGGHYDFKCDIYSFGITLWEILSRTNPVESGGATNPLAILWQAHSKIRPPKILNIPAPLDDLISRCWDDEPSKRPMSEEIEQILEIMMELYGNSYQPLIDLTTGLPAHAASGLSLHNHSAPSNLDSMSGTTTPSAPPTDFDDRRHPPPVPPRPALITTHRRGNSHDLRSPSAYSTNIGMSPTINNYPPPPPSYGSPTPPPYPSGPVPFSPRRTNPTHSHNTPPSVPYGFNINNPLPPGPVYQPLPYPVPQPPGHGGHLQAPGPSGSVQPDVGWRSPTEPAPHPEYGLGNGYSDSGNSSPNGSSVYPPKDKRKKSHGFLKVIKDFTKQ
uniref:Mitogen-activated protein kinase kinase kinase n=1 Tax=Panagrellus redivivus TaxID=6233 RepID=A0A7E4V0R3_PANRE